MLLVRARVVGVKAPGLLETKEPGQYSIEFPAPVRDTDTIEITRPVGYEVDELPPPVGADYSFAAYHSKTEANGSVIRYTRTYEIKELSVSVSKAEEVKQFNRILPMASSPMSKPCPRVLPLEEKNSPNFLNSAINQ